MDSRKEVLKQTGILALGVLLLSSIMVAIFFALGQFQMNVLWGALLGSVVIVTNHFFLSLTVHRAADRSGQGDVAKAKNMIQTSSLIRLIAMGAALVIGVKLGCNVIALALPLAFQRPVLMIMEFFGKKGD
ncbi:MAG: ATP synthase subunit I [Oscillospiraceae bacterium]|nr:ATP synthase subunit I [Oscillospiraceae bacterium]